MTKSTAPLRVLIIDDEPDITASLAAILRAEGYAVDTAHDGFAGMAIAQATPPGAVFLDIGMPGMSGYEVAKRLRQLPTGNGLLIVAVTGQAVGAQDAASWRAAGLDHQFTKPADPQALISLLRNWHPCPSGSSKETPLRLRDLPREKRAAFLASVGPHVKNPRQQ